MRFDSGMYDGGTDEFIHDRVFSTFSFSVTSNAFSFA